VGRLDGEGADLVLIPPYARHGEDEIRDGLAGEMGLLVRRPRQGSH
jgi:hypothetical protein